MWKLVFIVKFVVSFKFFVNPKGKPTKSKKMVPHLKILKNAFRTNFWKKNKNYNSYMDLWKYGQILTIQQFLTIK
jgi:hypothetical protein